MERLARSFVLLGIFAVVGSSALWVGCGGAGPCPENPCGSDEFCRDGICISVDGCPGGCLDGQSCEKGRCVWKGRQCESVGEDCSPNGPTNEGFACVPWSGLPSEAKCADVCSGDGECQSGSACVLLSSPGASSCESGSDCGPQETCSRGRCVVAACRPSECEGTFVGDATCQEKFGARSGQFPNGAKCHTVQNDASFCLPAGTKERGESCQSIRSAVQTQNYNSTCGRGLACVDGTCVKACQEGGDCGGEESCVGVETETIAKGVGQCAEACEPFTEGACDDGETCRPLGEGAGECIESGDREAFSRCDPGKRQCAQGTVCVTYQSGDPRLGTETIARCHPLCDLSAGERTESGTLTEEAQEARDATCPQPDPPPASFRVVHVEPSAGPIDLYRSGADEPLSTGLAAGADHPGSEGTVYAQTEAGVREFSALPEGAPETDLPLVEWQHRFAAGDARVFALTAPEANSDAELRAVGFSAPDEIEVDAGAVGLRVAHALTGTAAVDVVAVPPGEKPGASSNAVEVAAGLDFGSASSLVGVPEGPHDLHVFPAGADRTDPASALFQYDDVDLQEDSTLFLHGTTDPSDAYDTAPIYRLRTEPPPRFERETPPTTCVARDGGRFGYCQQVCTEGASDYGTGVCRGDAMGCRPLLRNDLRRREHLCAPVGEGAVGEVCNTFAEYGECAEGNYCLEYGNTREGYSSVQGRGICHSLCAVSGGGSEALSCPSDEECKPLAYRDSFSVGQCNVPCEPNAEYTDPSCPKGLRSCKPVATLEGPLGEPGDPPAVRTRQSFCSVSGDLEAEATCRAQNCRPSAECLYSRSEQSTLVRSLLSPYVGSTAGSPVCRPRCDPFDGDDSDVSCSEGETCLFNYPWTAEVGHCAEIVSTKEPGASCETAGVSCGEDSICASQGENKTCMRFCQYEGPNGRGELQQSTCPSGYKCHPFVRDIGVCRP